MPIFDSLAPILLLLALGAALARWKFLGIEFMGDLNRLAFWIALPAMMFQAIAHAGTPGRQTWLLLALLYAGTLLIFGGSWLLGYFLRMPPSTLGAFVQSSYRGNLAYIGVPVLAYAFDALPDFEKSRFMATALLVMAPMTALFNVLAVIALQGPQHTFGATGVRIIIRSILTNPLIIACAAGLIFALLHVPIPRFADRTLEALGGAAVPIALLCIGGSLASIRLQGSRLAIIGATLLKVLAAPLLAFTLCRAFGISGPDLKIALVLSACPTAAAAYIMARQLGGDEHLTSGAIALSTVVAGPVLAIALWAH